jgi:hypothetical protein
MPQDSWIELFPLIAFKAGLIVPMSVCAELAVIIAFAVHVEPHPSGVGKRA